MSVHGGLESHKGPFAPEVNTLLSSAFDRGLHDVTVTRNADGWNAALGAPASTIGSHIFLSSAVTEDVRDPLSMDILAHELAHALATPTVRTGLIDNAVSDRGEALARGAGSEMSRYVRSGGRGPAPALQPATGGAAVVHRWGTGEHKDSVDRTIETLGEAGRPGGGAIDPAVAAMLDPSRRIRLGNGVEVSPGEITALMGDFYGVFEEGEGGKQQFNPSASFEQLWNAPAEEMSALVELVRRDAEAQRRTPDGQPANPDATPVSEEEWEGITARRSTDQLSYLELAERNNSHFSGPTMEGVDNNMGVYSIFHQMALETAAAGTPEALERARALEASGCHYLTDRHASGHSFEKAGVMDAGGWTELGGNLAAKIVHDNYNDRGIDATNAGGASWHARGDTFWSTAENEENRRRTSESVYTSWSELAEVAGGAGRSAEQIERAGYGAHQTVPMFSPERQAAAEREASDSVGIWDKLGLAWEERGLTDEVLGRKAERAFDWTNENVFQPIGEGATDAYNWTDRNVFQPVGEAASDAYDWAGKNIAQPVGQAASDAYDWAGKNIGQPVAGAASDAYNWTDRNVFTPVSGAVDTVGDKAKELWSSIWD